MPGRRSPCSLPACGAPGRASNAVLARRSPDLPARSACAMACRATSPATSTPCWLLFGPRGEKACGVGREFSAQVRFVLETLREVYITDARARNDGLTPDQRLALHRPGECAAHGRSERCGILPAQFAQRVVQRMHPRRSNPLHTKRWGELTLFLRRPAPVGQQHRRTCPKKSHPASEQRHPLSHPERCARRRYLHEFDPHRRAESHRPFEYLVALQRNATAVAANPADWMPWNYQATLAQRGSGPDPPAPSSMPRVAVRIARLRKLSSKRVCELRASGRYGRYLRLTRGDAPRINQAQVDAAERLDGKFVVHSNDDTLNAADLALGYKQLARVEVALALARATWKLRPCFHWAPHRIHAHVALTVLSLLLERLAGEKPAPILAQHQRRSAPNQTCSIVARMAPSGRSRNRFPTHSND